MELILISDSKLKIMMTSEDMSAYDLNFENLDYDNTETRRAFWNILDEAKHKTGFDAASDKVFIQLYPSKSGGCEMYVTKLGVCYNGGSGDMLPAENTKISYQPRKNANKGLSAKKRTEIYKFENVDWLIKVCGQLYLRGYEGESAVYADLVKNMYFLCLSESVDYTGYTNPNFNEYSFIKEFGKSENPVTVKLYIKEYCKCICEKNAVKIFSEM